MATDSPAGKGDRHRSWTQEFRDGYDKIDWSKGKEPCGQEPATQPAPPGSEERLPEDT